MDQKRTRNGHKMDQKWSKMHQKWTKNGLKWIEKGKINLFTLQASLLSLISTLVKTTSSQSSSPQVSLANLAYSISQKTITKLNQTQYKNILTGFNGNAMGTPIRAKVHHHQLVSSILDGLVQIAHA